MRSIKTVLLSIPTIASYKNELSPSLSNETSDLSMSWGLSTITLGVNFYIAHRKKLSNKEPRIIED